MVRPSRNGDRVFDKGLICCEYRDVTSTTCVNTPSLPNFSLNFTLGSWRTLRDKSISVGGIDALFGVTVNPLNLFDSDMVFHAKIATLMAMLAWLLPLSAIVAPATLSIVFKPFGPYPGSHPVRNFDLKSWVLDLPDDQNIFATSLFNLEVVADVKFMGASQRAKKLVAEVLYSGEIPLIPSPCSANCSYSVEFHAPTLSCQSLGNSPLNNSLVEGVDSARPGYYTATMEPVGRFLGDENLSLKNRLLIGAYASKLYPNGTAIIDQNIADIQNVLCTPFNATYSVNINFTNGRPVFIIHNLELLSELDESASIMNENGSLAQGTVAWPARGLIGGIYDVLLGRMSYTMDQSQVVENTTITSTRLADSVLSRGIYWKFKFIKDLHLAIEELSHNLTLSLFSITDITTETATSSTTTRLVFQYSRATLIWTYSAAAAATLVCLIIGMMALRRNGIASDISFSRVLVTTRNPALDRISHGACLGGDPFPEQLYRTRLRFGELWRAPDGTGAHAGFGMEIVAPLRKGDLYQ